MPDKSIPRAIQAGRDVSFSVETGSREDIPKLSEAFPISCYRQYFSLKNADEIPLHWHRRMQFVRVMEGKLTYTINDQKIHLASGSMLLINSRQIHSTQTASENASTLCINFDMSVFNQELVRSLFRPYLAEHPFSYILPDEKLGMQDLIQKLCQMENKPADFLYLISFLYLLMTGVIEGSENREAQPDPDEIARFRRLAAFVHEHYMEDIRLKDITDAGLINRTACSELFRKYTGKPPMKYLSQYRLYMAKEMIRTTDMPISDISGRCGFNQQSNFISQFRRCYNITPLKYRQSCRSYSDKEAAVSTTLLGTK
ncbi:MAG: AraC family transcriptional regulator [Lachnospiraceae bacterium]|jgi:AraC-like DNA-binding protein/mannose-6-phosphate isomerase-like protein (cupin superfamily)